MSSNLLRTKPIDRILQEAEEHKGGLKRVLNAVDLTAIGVGAIIGAGIFVLTGTAAREAAGPGIMLSFVFAGFACILAALCYAEFATRLPISGSAYTYAYASVGELFAWIIGWDLILEYTIGASTVAVGWTHYLGEFLKGFGVHVPPEILAGQLGPLTVNYAAMAIVALLTTLLCLGMKESARMNAVMVTVKVGVVLFVIGAGIPWVRPEHWHPFLPFGFEGIVGGAAMIFFSYIGFDAVSTAAEEVKDPQKNLPIGIIASLVICTILYIAVAAVITGMVPYQNIDAGAPLAAAFGSVGNDFAQKLIGLGGFVGLTTVVLILLMSQPRIWFAMSRDGLMLPWFSVVHPRFRTPVNATILAGVIAAVMGGVVPMEDLHYMVSIGTLFAFVVVSASVLIVRYKKPEAPEKSVNAVLWMSLGMVILTLPLSGSFGAPVKFLDSHYSILPDYRMLAQYGLIVIGLAMTLVPAVRLFTWPTTDLPDSFKCPWVPLVPIVAMGANIYMMVHLNLEAWLRLWIWLAIGMVIYAFYGVHHSKLAKEGKGYKGPQE